MSDTLFPDGPDGGDGGFPDDGVERKLLREYTEKAYLDYSMYVINDRALPHIGDGLKPVQRRIIYSMSELGLDATAKYSKSARTVGDVLGKFHPHGDSACYEAMVLMAQDFSYRYPLVDGQGNWGAADDPKSFAAMRYTEARLTPIANLLLSEIRQGTVDFVPNFDGTIDEPTILPARLPVVLLNGSMGIAVGMATDIPPHNLREVVSAAVRLLEAPKSTVDDLLEHVKGPDFPTAAEIITPPADVAAIYRTGRGSIRARAVYAVEKGDIVISALPHQTSPTKIMEQIAQQMRDKKLPMIVGLRDEGDQESPIRIVLEARSNRIDVPRLMSHLFATTDLEKSFRVNMNMLGLDGRPQVKDLRTLLKEWLVFRTETVRRRLQFRLDKINDRLHILDGLRIAYLNIDEVIRIIREEDNPRTELMTRFDLSEIQANAILDIRLRQLAKLEEIKIVEEQQALNGEKADLEKTLGSERRLKTLLKKELLADAEEYGDDRRSPFVAAQTEARAFAEEDLLTNDPITIILSEAGWVRSAKGHEIDASTLSYRSGDGLLAVARGRSNQILAFQDSTGRTYSVAPHTLPSARSQGEPLSGRLNPSSGASFAGLLMGDAEDRVLLCSTAGYGFVVRLKELVAKNRAGKAMLSVPQGAGVVAPRLIDGAPEEVAAFTSQGRVLVFPLSELPELTKGKGNKLIQIPNVDWQSGEEILLAAIPFAAGGEIRVHAGKRHLNLKSADLEAYRGERARRGRKLPRGFQKVDRVEG